MSKKQKPTDVVEIPGGPIKRTNRFFIALDSYGHIDANGRTVLAIGCSRKKIPAPPDRPLAMMAMIINDLLPAMAYSSDEAMMKDLKQFQDYVAALEVS